MTPTPEDTAKGICEDLARAEAQFDERDWLGMPKHNRDRYIARCMLAAPAISQAIREAEDAAYDKAHREITLTTLANMEGGTADFIDGLSVAAERIESLKSPKEV